MWQEIASYIGGILGTAAAVAILALSKAAWDWLRAHLSEQNQKMLSDAAHKILVLGFTKVIPLIERDGWNSDAVRDAVLNFGIDEIRNKFPDAVSYIEKYAGKIDASQMPIGTHGGDMATVTNRLLRDVLQRAMPAAAAEAAASPVTPPVPAVALDTAAVQAAATAAATAAVEATGPTGLILPEDMR